MAEGGSGTYPRAHLLPELEPSRAPAAVADKLGVKEACFLPSGLLGL